MNTSMVSFKSPPKKFPKKPKEIVGETGRVWDYIVGQGGVAYAHHIDDDYKPIGPKIRATLRDLGLQESTSGAITIIFFP
jgi:hypothetical protein